MTSYVINWQGPFEEKEIPKDDFGLYLITGRRKYKRYNEIQYCGITETNFAQRLKNHKKKEQVYNNREFWFGKLFSDKNINRNDLEIIESLLIYFLQLPLNDRKKKNPTHEMIIINKWYKKNGEVRKNNIHAAQKIHDVIFWDGKYWQLSDTLNIYED